jgi:hypothetical protein
MEDAAEATLDLSEACALFVTDCFPSSFTTFADWVKLGKPKCWCNTDIDPTATGDYQCDGDTNNDAQVLDWRVYTNDLGVLASEWKKKGSDPTLNPCADIDHKGQVLDWRAYTADLGIMAANWKKKSTALPRDCGTLARPE